MNDVNDVIKDLIASRVHRNEMFTAYDVSKEVQQRGIRARHLNLRDVTHKLYADGDMDGYSRTLIDLGNGLQAFVYHPTSADPFTYKSKHLDGVAPTPAPATQPLLSNASGRPGVPDPVTGELDAEDRLNIPVEFFRYIGVTPGGYISLITEHDCIKITTGPLNTATNAQVTAKGNYRICRRIRSLVTDFDTYDTFTIAIDGTVIKVTTA